MYNARLCISCGKPVEPGKILCLYHLEDHRKRRKKEREFRVKNRLCIICGAPMHPEMDKGRKSCVNCRTALRYILKKKGEKKYAANPMARKAQFRAYSVW
jgi:hypothetical protein